MVVVVNSSLNYPAAFENKLQHLCFKSHDAISIDENACHYCFNSIITLHGSYKKNSIILVLTMILHTVDQLTCYTIRTLI